MQLDEVSYEPFHWYDDVRLKVPNKLACYAYKILYIYKVKTTLDMLKQHLSCYCVIFSL